VLKCQQTVYKTRSLQRRPVPSPALYYKLDYRVVIANKKVKGRPQPKRGKAPKRKQAPRRNASSPRAGTGLSHCSSLYAMSIARPFQQMEGVCIPSGSGPSRPSQKTRSITRFIATVGADAFGFALISPAIANDSICALYSHASYSSSQAAPYGLPTSEYGYATMPSLPFGKTLFTSGTEFNTAGVHGRIVSYGVRWRYIGSELKRSGRCYSLVHPDHGNLYGCSFTSLGGYKECLTTTTTREWTE